MAAAPGVTVQERLQVSRPAPPTDTAQLFLALPAPQGPSAPTEVRSLDQALALYGSTRDPMPKTGSSSETGGLHDSLEFFFREGGRVAKVSRVASSTSAAAAITLKGAGNTNTLTLTASGNGAWGNNLTAGVVVTGSTYRIQIFLNGLQVDESPDLTTVFDGEAWARNASQWVTGAAVGTIPPVAVAASALTGGSNGATLVDADYQTALNRFPKNLGPGQVAICGRTSQAIGAMLLDHGSKFNRAPLIDLPDTGNVSTLTAASGALAGATARFGAAFGGAWIVANGVAPGTQRVMPPSAIVAGLIGRVDPLYGAGIAAAGDLGTSLTAVGLTRDFPVESDRAALNEAGVNLFLNVYGAIQLFGYRSLANPTTQKIYSQFTVPRLLMEIKSQLEADALSYVFKPLDGQDDTLTGLYGKLSGRLLGYWQRKELYGRTSTDAYAIDTASGNTLEQLARGEVHVLVAVKPTPFAERAVIEVAPTPITEALAA